MRCIKKNHFCEPPGGNGPAQGSGDSGAGDGGQNAPAAG